MRLQLADGGESSRRVITLYNPDTGDGHVIPLSGPFKKLKTKIKAKKAVKAQRQQIRTDNKTKRITNRQESKTGRQEAKQARKQTRLDVRTAKQESKMIKVIGKRDVTAAQQASKIRKADQANQEAAAEEPTYDENSDQMPDGALDVPGGEYMMNPEDQGGDDDTLDPDYTEEAVEAEEEQPAEELSSGGDFDINKLLALVSKLKTGKGINVITQAKNTIDTVGKDLVLVKRDLAVIRQAVAPEAELSAGWIDAVFKVAKGAAGGVVNAIAPDSKVGNALLKVKDSKAGQAVTKLVNSKTGQAVQSVVTSQAQINKLNLQITSLKNQVASYKMQRYVWGAGGLVTGAAGVAVFKGRSK